MEIVKVEVYISIADLGKPRSDERGVRWIVCLLSVNYIQGGGDKRKFAVCGPNAQSEQAPDECKGGGNGNRGSV